MHRNNPVRPYRITQVTTTLGNHSSIDEYEYIRVTDPNLEGTEYSETGLISKYT